MDLRISRWPPSITSERAKGFATTSFSLAKLERATSARRGKAVDKVIGLARPFLNQLTVTDSPSRKLIEVS